MAFPKCFPQVVYPGNCAFPQNFYTRKLGEITAFHAVICATAKLLNTLWQTLEFGKLLGKWHDFRHLSCARNEISPFLIFHYLWFSSRVFFYLWFSSLARSHLKGNLTIFCTVSEYFLVKLTNLTVLGNIANKNM